MAGQVHLICTVQDPDWGAKKKKEKKKSSIWQVVNIFTVKEKKKVVIFVFSERKHGERESSSQNVTQYRKLLAMRKNVFFFLFLECCELSDWMCF